jgi:hypothetical protein
MTIVLQHQFWDLKVDSDRFEVGLSFDGIPERLSVPFAAIKGFFDPSVQFGLQFEAEPGEGAAAAEAPPVPAAALPQLAKEPPSRLPDRPAAPESPPPPAGADHAQSNQPPAAASGGDVVRLDRFRKKEDRGRTTEDGTKRR